MFTVISIMLLGVAVGYLFRNRKIPFLGKAITLFILLLLFLLGAQVGSNSTIMNNLSTIGTEALIITLGALLGSVLLSWGVYVWFFKNKTIEECKVTVDNSEIGGTEDER